MAAPGGITIVPFRDELAPAFDRLNRAWLMAGNLLEPLDEAYLEHPREKILALGGEVFFAMDGDQVLGTAAAIPYAEGIMELAKLSVAPEAQGRGLGRRLTHAVLEYARQHAARRVILTSNSQLHAALTLYRSLGFQDRPCPPGFGYQSADVYMELELE